MPKFRIDYSMKRTEYSCAYKIIEAKSLAEAKKKAKKIEEYDYDDFHDAMDCEDINDVYEDIKLENVTEV